MRTMTEQEAREQFGAALEATRTGPVVIRRGEEEVGVLISRDSYEEYRKFQIKKLLEISRETSEEAERRGLTDEQFEEIMRDVS